MDHFKASDSVCLTKETFQKLGGVLAKEGRESGFQFEWKSTEFGSFFRYRCNKDIHTGNIGIEIDNTATSLEEELQEEDPNEFNLPHQPTATLIYDITLCYSNTYRIPVCYFNISNCDGDILPWDQVCRLCNIHSGRNHESTDQESWFISQEEHPILGRPFYLLHPCGSSGLLDQLQMTNENDLYLKSWFVVCLNALGIDSRQFKTLFIKSS